MDRKEIYIPGGHNLENAMLCALLALSQGVEKDVIRETLRTFQGVEHRIEFVCERSGVRYINDSKGTNPDSTVKASRERHPAKAESERFWGARPLGISKAARLMQSAKALSPIPFTLEGRSTLVREIQPSKTPSRTLCKDAKETL